MVLWGRKLPFSILTLVILTAIDARAIVNGVSVPDSQYPGAIKILLGQGFDPSGENVKIETCSGVLISPSIALTAGHCLVGNDQNTKIALYSNRSEPFDHLVKAEKSYTELLPEDVAEEFVPEPSLQPGQIVAGCSVKISPVPKTKHLDLGLIKFSEAPIQNIDQIDFNYSPLIGIMNTIEQNCETRFGEDYGIENTATFLSSIEARNFLDRGLKYLDQ